MGTIRVHVYKRIPDPTSLKALLTHYEIQGVYVRICGLGSCLVVTNDTRNLPR